MGRSDIRTPAQGAAAAAVLAGLSMFGCATPGATTTATAQAVQADDAAHALRRRCAGHMYAERALRGGRGPLNRFEFDRCIARGASQ